MRLALFLLILGVDGSCTLENAIQEDGDQGGQQLLQMQSIEIQRKSKQQAELQFVHIPCTFGHTVEKVGLSLDLDAESVVTLKTSIKATDSGDVTKANELMESIRGSDGVLWGMMLPELRARSNVTQCELYYTPPKHWPDEVSEKLLKGKKPFAMLRDPYDRLANEFRMQAMGVDSVYNGLTREAVSEREGNLERESAKYKKFYEECDVNGYLQAELQKYLEGDKYRSNCHLLPSAEYFEQVFDPVEPVDERGIPSSFNSLMEANGYKVHMEDTLHNTVCNGVSAYSLSTETKSLIKQVYAADFALICDSFGYCDRDEMTCHENIEDMCGGKP